MSDADYILGATLRPHVLGGWQACIHVRLLGVISNRLPTRTQALDWLMRNVTPMDNTETEEN